MEDGYDVKVKVVSQQGTCAIGHKVGDEWVISETTPPGICLSAFSAFFLSLPTLMFGGTLPWCQDPDVTTVACSDPANPVVFELRRIRTEK